jgi:precorrin-4 methylase
MSYNHTKIFYLFSLNGGSIMGESPPGIEFEDIPLEEARRVGRGPRMDPALYDALTKKIQSLSTHAVRIRFEAGVNVTTMKNRIVRVARELNMPVTIRRVSGGLLFWRSSDEDLALAKETAGRLQAAQRGRQDGRRSRRRRT